MIARLDALQEQAAMQPQRKKEDDVSVDEFNFQTPGDLFAQVRLRARAKAAWKVQQEHNKRLLDERADELRGDVDAFLVASLGLSLTEVEEMTFEVEATNSHDNMPRLLFRKDGCRFRASYTRVQIMGSSSENKEFKHDPVYDFTLKVEVKQGNGWTPIKSLVDLGKLIAAGVV